MARLTRRSFVKHSVAAGAGLLAVPELSFSKSPNETLGVAVIGAGGRGSSHVAAYLADPRTEILYVVDADDKNGYAKCEIIEQKTGKRPQLVKDMRKTFDDKSVDLISTATPNHWHALCGVWAMQAGKDAYVGKTRL